jgi:hypothetical protein
MLDRRGFCLAALILAAVSLWALGRTMRPGDPGAPSLGHQADQARDPAPPMQLFGTMGKEVKLGPGEEKVLFERDGAGTLTHMWFGGSWPGWGDTLRLVWRDGEELDGHR